MLKNRYFLENQSRRNFELSVSKKISESEYSGLLNIWEKCYLMLNNNKILKLYYTESDTFNGINQ